MNGSKCLDAAMPILDRIIAIVALDDFNGREKLGIEGGSEQCRVCFGLLRHRRTVVFPIDQIA